MAKLPEQWLQENNFSQALKASKKQVTKDPKHIGNRFLLMELLVVDQQFEKAQEELGKIQEQQSGPGLELIEGLLNADFKRYQFLIEGKGDIGFIMEPPSYTGDFAKALGLLASLDIPIKEEDTPNKEQPKEVKDLEEQVNLAWSLVPKCLGNMDGKSFENIRDADDFLGPFLEALAPGVYLWLPWEEIKSISFFPPQTYIDVLWAPAQIEFKKDVPGSTFFIPTLYMRNGEVSDFFKLGNMTGFSYLGSVKRGYGQRDFTTGHILKGIRQVQKIEFL